MKLKKYKKSLGYTYTYGVYPTLDLLKLKPQQVVKIYLHLDAKENEGVVQIEQLCQTQNIRYEYASSAIDKISAKENTYALGVFSKYESKLVADQNHSVLVNPTNPGNLGTIIRTMNGFDFKNLAIIKPAVDVFDPMLIRASMGSFFNTNFTYFETFEEYQQTFRAHTMYPFMLNGSTELSTVSFEQPYALVFGNEGQGLNESFAKLGTSIYIQHSKNIDSLNLSAAVAIALHSLRS